MRTGVTDEDEMTIRHITKVFMAPAIAGTTVPAQAQYCQRQGADVSCDNGRRGVRSADAII
jgi:hypothetical protein